MKLICWDIISQINKTMLLRMTVNAEFTALFTSSIKMIKRLKLKYVLYSKVDSVVCIYSFSKGFELYASCI